MKPHFKILLGFAVVAASSFGAGCQTYNFEPVEPLAIAQTTQTQTVVAKALKPNIMLLVDKSGSMTKPTNINNANCATGNATCPYCGLTTCGAPPCNTAQCPTRMSDLQTAMNGFLTSSMTNTIANFGLMQLPTPRFNANGGTAGSCDPSNQADILVGINGGMWSTTDDPVAMAMNAQTVANQLNTIVPLGGTPTAQTLLALASDPTTGQPYTPLTDPARESFVILLTDGEPNCNQANPNDCTMSTCKCTFYTGNSPPPGSCPGSGCTCGPATCTCPHDGTQCASGCGQCEIGCIDTDAVVSAITALRQIKVRTIPVGFGLETLAGAGVGTGYAPDALNAMSSAGGFSRACPAGDPANPAAGNAQCNPNNLPSTDPLYDTCDLTSGLVCNDNTAYCCHRRYYVALDAAALATALNNITASIVNTSPCVFQLQAVPTNQQLVVVLVNGQDVPSTSGGNTNWTYCAPGQQCAALNMAPGLPTIVFAPNSTYCQQLSSATPQAPVQVEFRIVASL